MSAAPSKLLYRVARSAYLAYHLRGQTRFPFRSLDAIRRAQRRRVRAMVAAGKFHPVLSLQRRTRPGSESGGSP